MQGYFLCERMINMKNKEISSVKKLSVLGLLAALSVILVLFIHFPIFPSASFLEYDPADIPVLIGSFMFGPFYGLLLTVVVSVIQGFTVSSTSGIIGILMHLLSTGTFAVVSGSIYKKYKTKKGAVISLVFGSLSMVIIMVLWNVIFTPIFMGTPREAVLAMLVPVIIPFNTIKVLINSVITFFVYKKISDFIFR